MNSMKAGKPRLRKFHIGTGQSDQEIIDQFVVRRHELDSVLEVLEGNIDSDSCQHLLVVAPRGRGKTTLLVRVMAELRQKRQLSARLLPVRLMEESQEIFSLADFWLECLYYLAKSCIELDKKLSDELAASHAALVEDWADDSLEARARAAVLDAADRLERKLVIMVENLQSLCDEVDENFGWALRQVLQSEPQIMLLATATSRFDALENVKEPFFEIFRVLLLRPLDVTECRRLWEAISGEKVDDRSVRPLRILTGGSPRLMVVLAGFTRERSLRQLMEQLVKLIDDHTEYFRGQLEELASKERRVYIALIDLWQASTTAEVAARARMETGLVSALLGRLVKRGAVVAERDKKKRTYYAAERLYSIYYKLRRDRDEAAVVRNLVHFMVTYYQGDSLVELSRGLVAEASQSEGIRVGLVRAASELPELRGFVERQGLSIPASPDWDEKTEASSVLFEVTRKFKNAEYSEVVRSVDQILDELHSGSSIDNVVKTVKLMSLLMSLKGRAQGQLGESAAAIETYDLVVERFGQSEDPELQVEVARALVNKGYRQGQLGESATAIETYDSVVERFGRSEDPELKVSVARALVNKGYRQGQLGESAAEIETYDSVVERFGRSEDPELKVSVAKGLVNKGYRQGQLGESAAEIETYDSVVERFGQSEDPELQVSVARALINKGITQGQLGESAAAIETYDSVVERFGRSEDPELQVSVARALINKGYTQGQLGESAAAIETYDSVVERFGQSEDRYLQVSVAMAIGNAGESLCDSGDADSATAKVAQLRDYAKRTELDAFLVRADWVDAMAHALIGDMKIVEARFREICSRFDPGDEDALRTFQVEIPTLVGLGASPAVLARVVEEDESLYDVLRPLAVALRLEAGEKVRAPAEVLEVADDIRDQIELSRIKIKR